MDRGLTSPLTVWKTYNGENVVATLATSFLVGSVSFLQVTRTLRRDVLYGESDAL